MANPVVFFEFMSKDPEKVSLFYEKLFGWKINHNPELNYRFIEPDADEGIAGGIVKPDREGPWPGNMTLYVNVDDLGAYRSRIVEAGGKILIEEQEVPGMGSFTLFSDPEQRMMGLWKQAPSQVK